MRSTRFTVPTIVALGLLAPVIGVPFGLFPGDKSRSVALDKTVSPSQSHQSASARLQAASIRMPMTFTQNNGQWPDSILFRSSAGGATLWFTRTGVYHQFTQRIPRAEENDQSAGLPSRFHEGRDFREEPDSLVTEMIRALFEGANPEPEIITEGLMGYKCNFFLGNDPSGWRSNVPNFTSIAYKGLYPGIDVRYYGRDGRMEYDLLVAPGGDVSQVCIRYDGAQSIAVNESGELVVTAELASITERLPHSFLADGDIKEPVAVFHEMTGATSYGFRLERPVRRDVALVIDPVLVYSTYLGGSGYEIAYGIAVDDAGNAFVTGNTQSTDFPTQGPYQTYQGDADAFVTKLSATGSSLEYSTYLGGSLGESAYHIAVDGVGQAYVTGYTFSSDFPTQGPYQTYQGGGDAFVTKLSAAGNSLEYSTYLGGSWNDVGWGIALDDASQAYVTGYTFSSDFPTENPYQTYQGDADAFVTKLSATGSSLEYSTYLGGSGRDLGYAIALDDASQAYVTGWTESGDFPTENPYQAHQLLEDVFVTKLSVAGNSLEYSTYLGGSGRDLGYAIALDDASQAYVTGYTESSDFPTQDSYQTYQGGGDAFVTKLSVAGNSLEYSTYLGGSGRDGANDIAVDGASQAYVTGYTESSDFPTQDSYQTYQGGGDAFVTKLSSTGNSLAYSTYLGGGAEESAHDIAVDGASQAYVTGYTRSSDFPTVGPYQTDQGFDDVFVCMIGFRHCPPMGHRLATTHRDQQHAAAQQAAIAMGGSPTRLVTTWSQHDGVNPPTIANTVQVGGITGPPFTVDVDRISDLQLANGYNPTIDLNDDGVSYVALEEQEVPGELPYIRVRYEFFPGFWSPLAGINHPEFRGYAPSLAIHHVPGDSDVIHLAWMAPDLANGGFVATYARYDTGWAGPVLLTPGGLADSSRSCAASVVLAADPSSGEVACAWISPYEDDCDLARNITLATSSNNGDSWLAGIASPRGLSNYHTYSTYSAWSDLAALYDETGVLHLVWPARVNDGRPPGRGAMFHWDGATNTEHRITSGHWPVAPNPFAYDLHLANPTLALGTGVTDCDGESNEDYLYLLYTQFGGVWPWQKADISQAGYYNGDLYLTASADGGETWGNPANLTDTPTPNCDPSADEPCCSEHWASLPRFVDDTARILFVSDRDAGSAPQGEGSYTQNEVRYWPLSSAEVDLCPQPDPCIFPPFSYDDCFRVTDGSIWCFPSRLRQPSGVTWWGTLRLFNPCTGELTTTFVFRTGIPDGIKWLKPDGLDSISRPVPPGGHVVVPMEWGGDLPDSIYTGEILIYHDALGWVNPVVLPVTFYVDSVPAKWVDVPDQHVLPGDSILLPVTVDDPFITSSVPWLESHEMPPGATFQDQGDGTGIFKYKPPMARGAPATEVRARLLATTGQGIPDTLDILINPGCAIALDGDVNISGTLTSADIIWMVSFVFKGGAEPQPCAANGDVMCNGGVTSADIIYMVNFVFKGGPPPCDICANSPEECV